MARREWRRANAFVRLLRTDRPRAAGGPLELVFLNGCHSEALGSAVYEAGVPFVVCWRTLVENSAAQVFAATFFETLSQGHDYGRCFEEARSEVALQVRPGRLADGTPCAVPKYTLTDPEAPPEPYGDFSPRRRAHRHQELQLPAHPPGAVGT